MKSRQIDLIIEKVMRILSWLTNCKNILERSYHSYPQHLGKYPFPQISREAKLNIMRRINQIVDSSKQLTFNGIFFQESSSF